MIYCTVFKILSKRNVILLEFMINSKHVPFLLGGPLHFGPPNAYLWGGLDPPDPPGNRRACPKRGHKKLIFLITQARVIVFCLYW